jgi:hypothetical protein
MTPSSPMRRSTSVGRCQRRGIHLGSYIRHFPFASRLPRATVGGRSRSTHTSRPTSQHGVGFSSPSGGETWRNNIRATTTTSSWPRHKFYDTCLCFKMILFEGSRTDSGGVKKMSLLPPLHHLIFSPRKKNLAQRH